jgi:hypothetical protein
VCSLLGMAFENYLHTMARQRKQIVLMLQEYDQEKKKGAYEYKPLTFKHKEASVEGEDEAKCDGVMQKRLLVSI